MVSTPERRSYIRILHRHLKILHVSLCFKSEQYVPAVALSVGTGVQEESQVIKLSEMLWPHPEPLWSLIRQCGVTDVVALLDGGEQSQRMFASVGASWRHDLESYEEAPWSEASLRHNVETFATYGFKVVAIEDTAPMDNIRLGLPGRDEEIENVLTQVRAMGNLGIPVLCYNWMARTSWARTDISLPARGGALVTGFRRSASESMPPLAEPGEVTASQLWDALEYFLNMVVPVAEKSGVRLALHPDDPPIDEIRGVPRIMNSIASYRRLLGLVPSYSNAVTLCQGNFTLITEDLPGIIRELGAKEAIAFVHFRDVRGTANDFVETFHDEGQTDLLACMMAYAETGFSGPLRPDHVPTMFGEDNSQPAYGTLGRLFALGYIRGLQQASRA